MVNDHSYAPVRTSEWPPERYSDSDKSDSETDNLARWFREHSQVSPNVSRRMTTAAAAPSKPVRRWRLLPGRNKHLCNGRLMMAKQSGVFYFTVGLIVVTSGLFFGFDCPFLATRVNPVLPVVGGVMFIFVLSMLFRTSFMDPGIIPRADADEARDIEKQIEVQNGVSSPTYRPPPRTKEVVVNKVTVKLKYCFTCKIFRPPRASHCSICDNCVERFDHHCPWVGNCVGKRNYRFFYLFIVSLGFYCMFIFACVVTHLALLVYEKNQRFLDAVQETPASLVVAIVCFLSVWSILGLAGFHTYLIFSNQTTNEDIKGSFSSRRGVELKNPYTRPGFCGNCLDILCGPFHPSLLRRRQFVSPEDLRKNEVQNFDRELGLVTMPQAVVQGGASNLPSPTSSHPSYGTTENPVVEVTRQNPSVRFSNGSAPQSQSNPTPKRTRVAAAPVGGIRSLPPLAFSSSSSLRPKTHPSTATTKSAHLGDGFAFTHPALPSTRFAYSYSGHAVAPKIGPPRLKRPARRTPSFDLDENDEEVVYYYRSSQRE